MLAPGRDVSTRVSRPASAALPGAGRAPGRPWLLPAGAAALAAALALYAAEVATHPAGSMLRWFDLRVYLQAGLVARHAPATLYTWQLAPAIRFTYTPFAALLCAGLSWLPWPVLCWSMTVASLLALTATGWLAFGGLGWQGSHRAGAALAVTAVALWTEPVQRALHLGQVELLLMALIAWDLSGPPQRWWRGAGIGVAAGLKLVPLIFVPYLLLTRRPRQAAVAAGTFAALAGLGFAVLPRASVQWWLGPAFLRPGRTGFVAFVGNQSLRALAARTAGSMAASGGVWLALAAATAVAGLVAAAVAHRCGRPVAGWTGCALTGLLVSPVSWDHHWVWIAPGLAVLADAATRSRERAATGGRRPRTAAAGWWVLAAVLAAAFGGWPAWWQRAAPLTPAGLIWSAPGSWARARFHPEYHWHLLAWLAGNLYLLAGLAMFAVLAVAAARFRAAARAQPPAPAFAMLAPGPAPVPGPAQAPGPAPVPGPAQAPGPAPVPRPAPGPAQAPAISPAPAPAGPLPGAVPCPVCGR